MDFTGNLVVPDTLVGFISWINNWVMLNDDNPSPMGHRQIEPKTFLGILYAPSGSIEVLMTIEKTKQLQVAFSVAAGYGPTNELIPSTSLDDSAFLAKLIEDIRQSYDIRSSIEIEKGPRPHSVAEKRQIVERYLEIQSSVTQAEYAAQFHITERTLRRWLDAYRAGKL